jgi:hypothetical protein
MRIPVKKILLALFVCFWMFGIRITTAEAQDYWFFEIQVQGKGIQAVSDGPNIPPYPVFAESKHKLEKTTCYAMYDRNERRFVLAYESEFDASWHSHGDDARPETDKSVLPYLSGYIVYEETIGGNPVRTYVNGGVLIKFKEKNGVVKNARLKSPAMSYWQRYNDGPFRTEIFGKAKMKGKMIDVFSVPQAVLDEFGIQPVGP